MRRQVKGAAFVLICVVVLTATHARSATPNPNAVAPGGSQQRTALAGCMNQWLFNGIWRVKVTKLEEIKSTPDAAGNFDSGWGVTVEFRNGTSVDFLPASTGLGHMTLVAADGDTLDVSATTNGTLDAQKLEYHDFPPSSQYTHQLKFWYPYGTAAADIKKPVKFLLAFDASVRNNSSSGPRYTTSSPSMRIDLTCSK